MKCSLFCLPIIPDLAITQGSFRVVVCQVKLSNVVFLFLGLGWQNAREHNVWLCFPDCRASSFTWAQVQYYSTTGSGGKDGKDGPPAQTEPPVTAEKVLSAASQTFTEGSASSQKHCYMHVTTTSYHAISFVFMAILLKFTS